MNTALVLVLIGGIALALVLCWVPVTRKVGLSLLVLCLASGVWFWWEARGVREAFDSVAEDETEAAVIEAMGSPDRITDGTVTVWGGDEEQRRDDARLHEGALVHGRADRRAMGDLPGRAGPGRPQVLLCTLLGAGEPGA